ncbi:MAG: hypothetical protein H6556_26850 [Lewinellaceae bacterium]|nr:hypothetical protein [Lewinellaceae bacterium]
MDHPACARVIIGPGPLHHATPNKGAISPPATTTFDPSGRYSFIRDSRWLLVLY